MSRITTQLFGCLAATCCCLASPALACRQLVVQSAKLAEIKTVVLATVETSRRIEAPGWNTWRVTAKRVSSIEGSPSSERYEFTVTLSSNGCDPTLPPRDEKWVLYLGDSPNGNVLHAYPLDYVKEYDGRLATVG